MANLFPTSPQKAFKLLLGLALLETLSNLLDTWILPRVGYLGIQPPSPIAVAGGWGVLHLCELGVTLTLFRALRGQPGARLAAASAGLAAVMAVLCGAMVLIANSTGDPSLARTLRYGVLLAYGACPPAFAALLGWAVVRAAQPPLPGMAGPAYLSLRLATAMVRESTVVLNHLMLRATMVFVAATYVGEVGWVLADIGWIWLLVRILRRSAPESQTAAATA